MEWNQPTNVKSTVFNHLPIRLLGEIIQIGAVKLNDDWTPAEEFQVDVRPVYFRKLHFKVQQLTGIDTRQLDGARGFKEAFAMFRSFCGEDCIFLTWGDDDKGILEQNIIVHDEDWDWIRSWINLQLIYNMQTEKDRNQKSLSSAMEYFQITQTRTAHSALGDAYHTALLCSHLDMELGLAEYGELPHRLAMRRAEDGGYAGPLPLEHLGFHGYRSRTAVFDDAKLRKTHCPDCGEVLQLRHWVNQGDHRYMAMAVCPAHGPWLARLKLRDETDGTLSATRVLYRADHAMVGYYRKKSSKRRKYNARRWKGSAANAGKGNSSGALGTCEAEIVE